MKASLCVYPVGTTVEIGQNGDTIPATILAIQIEPGDHVSYKVAWWTGRERRESWVETGEVRSPYDPGRWLGFVPPKPVTGSASARR